MAVFNGGLRSVGIISTGADYATLDYRNLQVNLFIKYIYVRVYVRVFNNMKVKYSCFLIKTNKAEFIY